MPLLSNFGWTKQVLVYADVYLLGKNINARKKVMETLLLTSNEDGLGMVIDKTKYMLMCCEQNAEQFHNL